MSENFVYDVPKTLPVILLLDTSGSMSENNKIESMNNAVNTMLKTFKDLDSVIASISVCVITFGGSSAQMICPLTPATEILDVKFKASGMTPFGDALRMAKELIEAKENFPSRSYRPTIITVSDGMPNDNWESELGKFKNDGRSAKCHCMAMYIDTCDAPEPLRVLAQFTGDKESVFHAKDAQDIKKFFRFVTTTIKTRTQSINPNIIPSIDIVSLPDIDIEDDEDDILF